MKNCQKVSRWALLLMMMSVASAAHASRWSHFLSQENVGQVRYDSVAQIYWFGTSGNGVWRFDGRRFERFEPVTGAGVRELRITALAVDAIHDTLWVGTPAGLFAYHLPAKTWTYAPVGAVTALLVTPSGALWYGTKNCEIGNRRGEKWRLATSACVEITCFAPENLRTIYIGTYGAGLYRLDCSTPSSCSLIPLNIAGLENVVTSLAIDRHKNKWIGTLNGVAVLDSVNRLQRLTTANSGLVDNTINAIWIEPDGDGDFKWFGTENGVSALNGSNALWLTYNRQNSGLAAKEILDVTGDHDGNLWFAFRNELGVNKLDNNWAELTTANVAGNHCLRSDFFYAIEKDGAGRLWCGNDSGAINVLENGVWKCPAVDDGRCQNLPPVVRDFSPHRDGMWVATAGCGILNFSDTFQAGPRLRRNNSGIPSDFVYALAVARDTLWAGTFLGLAQIVTRPQVEVQNIFDNNLPAKRINALAHDERGRLWIGTALGLVIYDHGKLQPVLLDGVSITALARDSSGAMWVGTEQGLERFIGAASRHFSSQQDGLPDDRITCLGVAPDGTVWCGTANGAASFTGNEWIARTSNDGLSNNFIRQITFASGNVWFATFGGGLARYRQTQLGPNTFIENPFEAVTETNVTFRYSGFDFNTPALSLAYQYALDTMQTWSPITSATFVTLPVDSAGVHVFRVRAIDKNGNADASPAAMRFYKLRPERGGVVDSTTGWGGSRLQVYLPPLALLPGAALRVAAIGADSLRLNAEERLRFTGIAYQLFATKAVRQVDRPVTVKIFYDDRFAQQYDERTLALYRYEAGQWVFTGGTADVQRHQIVTTIPQLGVIALFAGNLPSRTTPNHSFALTAQPRMLAREFAATTTISFELDRAAGVTAKIYNLAGRLVQTLCENAPMNPGRNALEWNGRDRNGYPAPSGMYLICVQASGRTETKTVVVVNQ